MVNHATKNNMMEITVVPYLAGTARWMKHRRLLTINLACGLAWITDLGHQTRTWMMREAEYEDSSTSDTSILCIYT